MVDSDKLTRCRRNVSILVPLCFPFTYLVAASLKVEDINELTKTANGPLSELLLESLLLFLQRTIKNDKEHVRC